MSREFRMPSLGADMEAGTLVQWRVQPGVHVHRGDVVALVETEKGIIDIETFEEGVIERLVVEPGTRVPVGTALALFEGEPAPARVGEEVSAAERAPKGVSPQPATVSATRTAAAPGPAAAAAPAAPIAPAAPVTTPAGAAAHAPRMSPAARVRAAALGIDAATLQRAGFKGVITLQDVERVAAANVAAGAAAQVPASTLPPVAGAAVQGRAPTLTPAVGPTQPQPPAPAARAGMRNAIAAAMSRSKREIPHYYLHLAMDFQPAAHWLEAYNESRPVPQRLLTAVLLIKAAARAAAEKPGFNGYFEGGAFAPSVPVHMGVAIALRGGGLVAPALFDAQDKPLPALMLELQDLVGRVRSGHMRSREISSATLTVTSLGDEGVETMYPIIYPPQVAIVGFGSVIERPWVVEGKVEVRPVMNLTLAADHRVTDGRLGAQFLSRIRDWLSRPGEL